MDPRLEANRANWNERVGVHITSRFYDVEGWLRDAPLPPPEETDFVGDVHGRNLVHLQCHFGMDTLRWARAGAHVTGIDFSPEAVREATLLAQRAGLAGQSRFVCANVYDAPAALAGERFDVVYVSLGSLCWLPDVHEWGAVVAQLLKPGGRLFIHEVHPFITVFDDDGERVTYDYFADAHSPLVVDDDATYTDGARLSSTTTYEWIQSIESILHALLDNGLVLEAFREHDWTVFQQTPWLEAGGGGRYTISAGRPRVPLTFTIAARLSSTR